VVLLFLEACHPGGTRDSLGAVIDLWNGGGNDLVLFFVFGCDGEVKRSLRNS
jgi:hypothetical protein